MRRSTIVSHKLLQHTLHNANKVPTATGSFLQYQQTRSLNTVINFVPQQEAWIIERFGMFHRIAEAGIHLVVPVFEQIAYVQSLKEMALDVPSQSGITSDNVTLSIDGVLYIQIDDPYKASYGIQDFLFAVSQLAQTTMRSEIGKITLDKIFQERETLNGSIVEAINSAAKAWGVVCLRYEIKDIEVPTSVQQAMQMQVEAERKKRAHILESEGLKTSKINVAEGDKQAVILRSEANKAERVNEASGISEALRLQALARAEAIERVALAIQQNGGDKAAAFAIAEQYMSAFRELAQESTTLMLPTETSNPSSMIAQAMSIYKSMNADHIHRPNDDPHVTPSKGNKTSPKTPVPPTSPFSSSPSEPQIELFKDSHTRVNKGNNRVTSLPKEYPHKVSFN